MCRIASTHKDTRCQVIISKRDKLSSRAKFQSRVGVRTARVVTAQDVDLLMAVIIVPMINVSFCLGKQQHCTSALNEFLGNKEGRHTITVYAGRGSCCGAISI